MKAFKIKDMVGWQGDAAAYTLDPPYQDVDMVIVSALEPKMMAWFGPRETMAFPCTSESLERNQPSSWGRAVRDPRAFPRAMPAGAGLRDRR